MTDYGLASVQQYPPSPHPLAAKIIDDTRALIDARLPGPRNQGADDAIFGPANDGIILAINHRDPSMARQIFVECYYQTSPKYEAANTCQIHKGSITFNVGIAYLRSDDFAGALHYFELAEEEDVADIRTQGRSIFSTPSFSIRTSGTLSMWRSNTTRLRSTRSFGASRSRKMLARRRGGSSRATRSSCTSSMCTAGPPAAVANRIGLGSVAQPQSGVLELDCRPVTAARNRGVPEDVYPKPCSLNRCSSRALLRRFEETSRRSSTGT